jgi:ubiquinone/menaquinone biosynthesis C-methylase UbiE
VRAKATYIIKAIGRRIIWAPSDLARRLKGDDAMVPPRGLSFVGHGDFEQTGKEFLGHFVELGELEKEDRVLDIGCGIGRMAIPMTGYLEGGSYEGFDVGKEMISWCKRHVTRRYPSFQFSWSPIYNQKYNPFGTVSATEFRFPYEDDTFDFALATSLFTHLTTSDADHYLDELGRVLKPGATALLTFFLITPESVREVAAGRAEFAFTHPIPGALTTDPRQPEEAIAFTLDDLSAMLDRAGLEVRAPIHRGSWANAPSAPSFQDIVVVQARGD